MKQLLLVLCTCLALGLVVAGCGGDDDDSGDGAPTAAQTETTETTDTTETAERTDTAGAGGDQIEVEVVDIDYEPAEVSVPVGTTVRWTNTGNMPHTVTKEDGPGEDFDSGIMASGDVYEYTFETAGEIAYHCTLHPGQDGTVTVE